MAENYSSIITDLKNKIYKPVYFLQGEEPYYIDQITDFIINNVLSPAERDFNQTIVYGKDIDAASVVNLAKRYPMMSNYQVVVVKEAQNIKGLEDALAYYMAAPLKSTILVINYKYDKIDGRKSLVKLVEKSGVLFESKRIYDNQLPDWIMNYLAEKKLKIRPDAALILSEFLGNDLSKIVNELDKLSMVLPAGNIEINSEHIEKNIGISKEYNVFELNNAVCRKDILKANKIIHYFSKNPTDNHISVTISTLFSLFGKVLLYHSVQDKSDKKALAATLKINPFFLKDYATAAQNYSLPKCAEVISLLREYDLKSKGVDSPDVPDYALSRELLFKIMH